MHLRYSSVALAANTGVTTPVTRLTNRTVRFFLATVAAALLTATLALPSAEAQTLQVSDNTVTALLRTEAVGPHYSVVNEYNNLAKNTKVKQLLTFASQQMGTAVSAYPQDGISVRYLVRWAKTGSPGLYGDLWVRTLVIPLNGVGTGKNAGATAVMEISYYESTPQILIPRLAIRYSPKNWTVVEYSFDRTNRVVECAASKGHCLFRSALKLLENKSPAAHRSLRSTLDATASKSVGAGLKAVLDPRGYPTGQGELLLATGIFTAVEPELEYDSGYVSGTIDNSQDLRFDQRDNALIKQVKNMLRDELKNAAKEAGKKLLQWLLSYFGFSF
jgi:hypothetical protein